MRRFNLYIVAKSATKIVNYRRITKEKSKNLLFWHRVFTKYTRLGILNFEQKEPTLLKC